MTLGDESSPDRLSNDIEADAAPHIRHTPDLGGTTLMTLGDESSPDRLSNDIEADAAPHMSEHGTVGKERKSSFRKIPWSGNTSKSKG
jgi:hypothetical protein